MDVDVNRPILDTKVYEIEGIRFCGSSPRQMIADKIVSISSDMIFRRIKDFIDLYYLSQVFEIEKDDIIDAIEEMGRELGDFQGFLGRKEEIKYSFNKFRFSGDVEKPCFEEVYSAVSDFLQEFLIEYDPKISFNNS